MPAYKPKIPIAGFFAPPDESSMPDPLHATGLSAYGWTLAACAGTTLIATPMYGKLEAANIVMLFLLNVVMVGMRLGRGPAMLASVLGVALFDFFFVPPRFTFAIGDLQYQVVFAVMLVVGLIAGEMTARLRFQATAAAHGEARARALYEFARELSGVLLCEQVLDITRTFIRKTFNAQVVMLLPDAAGRLQAAASGANDHAHVPSLDIAVAQWAFDHAMPAGMGDGAFPGSRLFYLPLLAPMRARRTGDFSRDKPLAVPAGTEAASRHLRHAGRDCTGAGALHRGGTAGTGTHGVGAAAQFPAVSLVP
jgi:two-component system sensor histidine kinase KdpD